jgi:hypothetical protein
LASYNLNKLPGTNTKNGPMSVLQNSPDVRASRMTPQQVRPSPSSTTPPHLRANITPLLSRLQK